MGQFAIRSTFLLGAERVIAIDHVPERLEIARRGGAEVLHYADSDLMDSRQPSASSTILQPTPSKAVTFGCWRLGTIARRAYQVVATL